MQWDNFKTMQCPACSGQLKDQGPGYCCSCGFCISYERFQTLIKDMYKPQRGRKYDPDAVDRSGWN